jgi:hypothetical protein
MDSEKPSNKNLTVPATNMDINTSYQGASSTSSPPVGFSTTNKTFEEVILNNIRRLEYLCQELQYPQSFKRAAIELGLWCKDPRAYMPETENALFQCVSLVRAKSPTKGFHLLLGWYVLRVIVSFSHCFSPEKAAVLRRWFSELSKCALAYKSVMKPFENMNLVPTCEQEKQKSFNLKFSAFSEKIVSPISSSTYASLEDLYNDSFFLEDATLYKVSPKHDDNNIRIPFRIPEALQEECNQGKARVQLSAYAKGTENCEWPIKMNIFVDGKIALFQRKRLVYVTVENKIVVFGVDSPIVLNNVSDIEIVFEGGQCACAFEFAIKSYRPVSFSDLIKKVESQAQIAKAETLKYISESNNRVSLSCPLKDSRMVIPVKGTACQHLQAFDFLNYLSYNSRAYQFKCPVCNKDAPLSELRVDELSKELLSMTLTTEITLDANGVAKKESPKRELQAPKRELQADNAPNKRLRIQTQFAAIHNPGPNTAAIMTPNTEASLKREISSYVEDEHTLKYLN